MRPEARSAARAEAIKAGKEKRSAAQSVKKAEKAKTAAHTTGRYVQLAISTPSINANHAAVSLESRAPREPHQKSRPRPAKAGNLEGLIFSVSMRDA